MQDISTAFIISLGVDFAHCACEDAAIYFNPWNVGDIADKILLLKNDPDLEQKLVEKGKSRIAAAFKSWG